MLQGEDDPTVVYDLSAVQPEEVVNVEAGLEWSRPGLSVRANAYSMAFRNEIAQTGELSEVGLPLRRNVDRSARRGVEVDVTWQPVKPLQVRHSAAYSYNRIRSWTQSYDVYDDTGAWAGATSLTHDNVVPLLTPAVLVSLGAEYAPANWVTLGAAGRYVGAAHLDNTNNGAFTAPASSASTPMRLSRLARLVPSVARAAPRLRIQVTNLLNNRRMFPNGYSYQVLPAGRRRKHTARRHALLLPAGDAQRLRDAGDEVLT